MEILIPFLFGLATILVLVTLVGHGIWVLLRSIFRLFTGSASSPPSILRSAPFRCQSCNFELSADAGFCGHCGWHKPVGIVVELLKDLASTERQIQRFHSAGTLDDDSYQKLKAQIDQERLKLDSRSGRAPSAAVSAADPSLDPTRLQLLLVTRPVHQEQLAPTPPQPPSVVTASFVATDEKIVIEPTPSFRSPYEAEPRPASESSGLMPQTFTPPRPPRRSFAEMLNSFMEESNIRWGELPYANGYYRADGMVDVSRSLGADASRSRNHFSVVLPN